MRKRTPKPTPAETAFPPEARGETPAPETPKEGKTKEQKATELETLIAQIEETKGKNVIRRATELPIFNCLSTGAFTLDFALLGGIPEGLATMIYGHESSGKTTLSMKAVAAAQRKHPDKKVAWVDGEGTFDKEWAMRHGVDLERLFIVQPTSGEDAVDIVIALMEAWEICLVVVDSIPALVPRKLVDDSAGDANVALLARLVGKLCSKATICWAEQRARGHWVTLILINQFRSGIGMFAPPNVLPGGRNLNYFVTTKVNLKNKVVMGKDQFELEVAERNEHAFKLEKSKIGSSILSGEFQMTVNPDHPLGPGVYLDAATVAAYSKRMGLISGGGNKWKIKNVQGTFGKLAEIEDFLYANDDEFLRLKQFVVAQQRIEKGLPALPPDGFLLDWNARENLAELPGIVLE